MAIKFLNTVAVDTDVLYVDTSSNNVGIGTTSPGVKLHVDSSSYGEIAKFGRGLNQLSFGIQSTYGYINAQIQGTTFRDLCLSTNFGNVGIGTTVPSQKLDVVGSAQITNDIYLGRYIFHDGDTDTWFGFPLADTISFRTNNSDRMYITSAGNVGIGTTSPGAKLDVVSGDIRLGTNAKYLRVRDTASAQPRVLGMNASNNFYIGPIDSYAGGSMIYGTSGNMQHHRFYIAGSEKVRITSGGNVGIGTTSPSSPLHIQKTLSGGQVMAYFDGTVGPSTYGALNVRVDNIDYGTGMRFYRSGIYDSNAIGFINGTSTVGSININTSSTSYNTTSDYRLKENLTEITDGIDRIKQLKPKRFNFIGDTTVVDGFIAHEAKQVVPEAVTGEKDEVLPNGDPVYQGIDQAKIVPLLTAALQEAIAKIEVLENRLQILENK